MAAFSFALYYNVNKAFWPDFGGFFQKNQPYPQLFSEHFAGCLVFLRIFVYNVSCWILSMRRCGMNGIKGYISIREASYRWGVSERRVNQYCAEGRIPGASRFGRSWAIPEDAEKPSDPRRKAAEGGDGHGFR